jgi:predicted flap endonuclease-1-like 5' DNA nuclease
MRGVPYNVRAKLQQAGIDTGERILAVTRTPDQRRTLAEKLSLSPDEVEMVACQADLARVKGVGGVFAVLLQKAGINTVDQLARRDPDRLYFELCTIKEQDQIAGRAPTYRAVCGWVAHARELRDGMQV